MDMKREAMSKPYDSKKSHWCPDGSGGFVECLLENDDGKKATVMVGHEVENIKNLSMTKYLAATKYILSIVAYTIHHTRSSKGGQ